MHEGEPFSKVPIEHQTNEVDVLFITDRAVAQSTTDAIKFGSGRSHDIIYGEMSVRIGSDDVAWNDLVMDSTQRLRSSSYPISVSGTREIGILRDAVDGYEMSEGIQAVISEDYYESLRAEDSQLADYLSERLSVCDRKDVYIYVHGVNTSMPIAAETISQIWHFLGRDGVPIAYSWPAAEGGLLAYAYSRESSEFTVSHLKRVLRVVSSSESVERVHLIAHSQGANVVLTALRELHIQAEAASQNPSDIFKIDTVVLAAADIDLGVFRERVIGERVFMTPRRIVIYTSVRDEALSLADRLLGGVGRVGELVLSKVNAEQRTRDLLPEFHRVQLIVCEVDGPGVGHNYFYTNPAVLSDLILVLRDRLDPGVENGRPLEHTGDGTWLITDSYPRFKGNQK